MKQYSADVFVNGDWRCGCGARSKKRVIEGANKLAEMFRQDAAKTAELLKIRNLIHVEVTIGRKKYRQKIGS